MNGMEALRRSPSDEGFTLVELLVTMVITGLVLAMAGAFFVNISRLTSWSGRERTATGQAALALDAVRAVVRVAVDNDTSATNTDPAVLVAKPSTLTLTAYSDPDDATVPNKVTFTVDASGNLYQYRYAGTLSSSGYWTFPAAATSTRLVASGFSAAPSTPFFTYVSASGAPMSSSAGLSLAQRQTLTFVRVTTTLDMRNSSGASDPAVVTSSVGMPNLQRNVSASVTVPNLPTPTPPPVVVPSTAPPSTPAASSTPTTSPSASTGTGTGSGGTGGSTPTTGTGTGSATPTATPRPTATATTSAPPPPPPPTPTATPTPTPTPRKPVVG